jgi:hypothetical protein
LTIPTWLVFLFLAIASFAPIVNLQPRWWAPYYGALLMCWVVVSVAAVRRMARDDQKLERTLAKGRQLRDAKNAEPAETGAEPARDPLDEGRLIIVARDEASLYDYIRRRQSRNQTVSVITDRRRADRRHRMEAHVPDRRRGERRRYNIEPLLRAQGWAQVTLPKS